MRLFDLNLDHKFSDDLQKNLDIAYKILGDIFQLKYKDYVIPMQMYKVERGDLNFYEITYYDEEFKGRRPIRLGFINPTTGAKDGTVEFGISRLNDISGSTFVEIGIKLAKTLGCKKGILLDRATVWCPGEGGFELSLMKLIESNKTFYEELGFTVLPGTSKSPYFKHYSLKSLMQRRKELIETIRKTKISDILKLCEDSITMLKKNDTRVMSIKWTLLEQDIFYVNKNENERFINSLVTSLGEISRVMKISKKEFFSEFLVDLARLNCTKYSSIMDFYMENNFMYIVKNGEDVIKHDYIMPLHELQNIKNFYEYEINLNK